MNACGALIDRLGNTVVDTVRSAVVGAARAALIDFPDHSNVGDSAIWLGEVRLLRALGLWPPCYVCTVRSYDFRTLRQRLGPRGGIILIHGGGNFGDLWPMHQQFREEVVRSFPDCRIVQLPQSIHFRSASMLAAARSALNDHPDLTILARDERSQAFAAAEFRASVRLCPDSSFCLGPLPHPDRARESVIWLGRTDHEADPAMSAGDGTLTSLDWLDENATFRTALLRRIAASHSATRSVPLMRVLYGSLAGSRLRRGQALLGAGRVMITDRLHAHILGILMGIPHVLLDNCYGKLAGFHQTWTRGCPLVQWAESPAQARSLAAGMLEA